MLQLRHPIYHNYRLTRRAQILLECADFAKSGCNRVKCEFLSEIYHSSLSDRVKLTKQGLLSVGQSTGKSSEIAGFVVFGGGKPYIGTVNRRKQSAKKFLSGVPSSIIKTT